MDYEFLCFNKRDIASIPNAAKLCSNFRNNEKAIHLPPYYFCCLCLKQFCYNCTTNHLLSNKEDHKHNSDCMVSEEFLHKRKEELMRKTSNLDDNLKLNHRAEIEFIENERIILSKFRNDIIEKLNKLDNYLEKKINVLRNMNIDKIINNKKQLNNNSNSFRDSDFLESLNNLNNIKEEEEFLRKILYTSLNVYRQIDDKLDKKKDKMSSEIISCINNYRNQLDIITDGKNTKEKDNKVDNKYLNNKRKRGIDDEEMIESISYEDTKKALNILFPSFINDIDKKVSLNKTKK